MPQTLLQVLFNHLGELMQTQLSQDLSQFLTFRLWEEEYGLDILRVQEIRGYSQVTPLPNSPKEVLGMMNLRGTVVPIIDLRIKFGMNTAAYNRFTVIIVVNLGTKYVGLVVDAVSDVLNFALDDITPPPELGTLINTAAIKGIARSGERLINLLNLDSILNVSVATA